MSYTFTIANNQDFCVSNNLVGKTVYNCQCFGWETPGKASTNCRECGGSGKVSFDHFPFEMNISGNSLFNILQAIGYISENEYCGELSPQVILNKQPHDVFCYLRSNFRGCGMAAEQWALSVTVSLYEVAKEADRRKKNIVWG